MRMILNARFGKLPAKPEFPEPMRFVAVSSWERVVVRLVDF
jgi:hypothetical protein